MSYPPHDFDSSPVPPPGAARARDRGLTRIRGLTAWIVGAAVAGAAALGAVYTHVLPGSSAAPAPGGPVGGNPAVSSPSPSAAGHGSGGDDQGEGDGERGDDSGATARPGLRPPAQAPAPTVQQPQTTTGAS
ncbi:hypothetical protein ABZT17_33745 [Streptomyces sp. NPDC005648]|uniref:hypothetical protein n=1 Tax=Streptomyces sp. NPDC005648 TaxID=3157044 RepID=UPI0033A84610